jgi:PAS domain S-box-containing protein
MVSSSVPTESNIEYCPVSGLVVFRYPQWQNCPINENYRVDFCFIGRRIMLVTHHGDPQYQNVERLYELRARFLAESQVRFGSTSRIVEMRDYSDVHGMPSKETRVKQSQFFYDHQHQVLGVIVFNMAIMIRAIFRMGLTLSRAPFPFEMHKDYSSAIQRALHWIETSQDHDQIIVSELPDWNRSWGGLSMDVGQIGNRILLTRPAGWMRVHHVEPVIDLYRAMRSQIFARGEPYIHIADYKKVTGADMGVRFRLAKAYQRLNQESIAPVALILVGASPLMKTTFSVVRRWIGKTQYCDSLAEAIQISDRIFNDDKGRLDLTSKSDPKDQLGGYIQEMIEYVASFSWDEAEKRPPNLFDGHPFRGLYDALELVRCDLEELLKRNMAAKQDLAEKESYYRGLYELTADAIILFDGNSLLPVDANPAALTLLGCMDLTQFRGIAWWRFLAGGEDQDIQFKNGIREVCEKGVLRMDWEMRSLEARPFTADIQFSAISGRSFPVVMAVIRDISEKRRIEEEIRSARDAAQKANEAKNDFLANMSHEVRTPLNGILGLTELLMEEESETQKIDHLKDIKRSGESLLEIVSEILDFSRIETGRIQIEKMEFDLGGLVRRVIRMFAVKCHDRGLEMLCDFEPEAQGTCIADPVKIRQILVNLVGNAVKFTENGFVMLTVRGIRESGRPQGLRFVIRDTGIGIPADQMSQVFERFYQVDSSMSRRQGGTGLGLSICKRLVMAMGGTISVSSKFHEGSSFEVELPIEYTTRDQAAAQGDLYAHRLLIFDPHPLSRMILLDQLSRLGQHVAESAELEDFLSQMDRDYDHLDGMIVSLGIDDTVQNALMAVMEKKGNKRIPILLLSQGRSLKLDGNLLALGVNETLLKPIFPSELHHWLTAVGFGMLAQTEADSTPKTDEAVPEPYRILVAEDNEINQKMISRLLGKRGWEVLMARNGQEAVNLYFSRGADLVLMDLQMPVMDGYQAAQTIRNADGEGKRRIPIVALTAHAQNTHMEKSYASGMDAYLTKPISSQALYGLIERLQEQD